MKNFTTWNKATIAKLVYAVSIKKDVLCVKWVHTRYIKNQEWCDYSHSYDSSWCWKKICSIKDYSNDSWLKSKSLDWKSLTQYRVSSGYSWQQENHGKVNCDKIIWARTITPRHAFITWVYIQNRLPTKLRLRRFQPQRDITCELCHWEEESA